MRRESKFAKFRWMFLLLVTSLATLAISAVSASTSSAVVFIKEFSLVPSTNGSAAQCIKVSSLSHEILKYDSRISEAFASSATATVTMTIDNPQMSTFTVVRIQMFPVTVKNSDQARVSGFTLSTDAPVATITERLTLAFGAPRKISGTLTTVASRGIAGYTTYRDILGAPRKYPLAHQPSAAANLHLAGDQSG